MTLLASPASADGLHIFAGSDRFVWSKGCTVTYSLDSRASREYSASIKEGLARIGKVMKMTFTRVDPAGGQALLRYTENSHLPHDASGAGSTTGDVQLAPLRQLTDWGTKTNRSIRLNLVVHVTLHAFGLDHDFDDGQDPPDEIMFPMLPTGPLHFGNGDLTGMKYIRDKNKCGQPAAPSPADTPTRTPTPVAPIE